MGASLGPTSMSFSEKFATLIQIKSGSRSETGGQVNLTVSLTKTVLFPGYPSFMYGFDGNRSKKVV